MKKFLLLSLCTIYWQSNRAQTIEDLVGPSSRLYSEGLEIDDAYIYSTQFKDSTDFQVGSNPSIAAEARIIKYDYQLNKVDSLSISDYFNATADSLDVWIYGIKMIEPGILGIPLVVTASNGVGPYTSYYLMADTALNIQSVWNLGSNSVLVHNAIKIANDYYLCGSGILSSGVRCWLGKYTSNGSLKHQRIFTASELNDFSILDLNFKNNELIIVPQSNRGKWVFYTDTAFSSISLSNDITTPYLYQQPLTSPKRLLQLNNGDLYGVSTYLIYDEVHQMLRHKFGLAKFSDLHEVGYIYQVNIDTINLLDNEVEGMAIATSRSDDSVFVVGSQRDQLYNNYIAVSNFDLVNEQLNWCWSYNLGSSINSSVVDARLLSNNKLLVIANEYRANSSGQLREFIHLIIFDQIAQTISVTEFGAAQSKLKVYPNPSVDYLVLASNKTYEKVQILNVEGQLMREVTMGEENRIDIQELRSGTYYIKAYDKNGGIETTSFIKSN